MRKSSKFQYVYVLGVNSSGSTTKVALDIRGSKGVSTPTSTQM